MSDEHKLDAEPLFRINDLTLSLANQAPILQNVSLTLPKGKVTALIGPSGSGKSTLLRCLNRLWEPPAATIFLNEQDVTQMSVLDLRRRVGMLMQGAALFPGTIAENVRYGPALQGTTLSNERVTELLTMASLDPGLSQKPADALSGGQAQRVSLARTLANEPDVLLLDEPTSALDPAATRTVEETIFNLRKSMDLTVIWVSHSVEQVQRTAEWVVLLVDGKVVETGRPDHLLSGLHHHMTEDFAAGKIVSQRQERSEP